MKNVTDSSTLHDHVGKSQTVVVDSAMSLVGIVHWTAAMTKVVANDAYTLIPRIDGGLVRSESLTFERPLVICLNRYVGNKRPNKIDAMDTIVSNLAIKMRDNYTCRYCGEFGDTIDHIQPKSRGGDHSWGNLVVACFTCNNRKDNRTPEEAGMVRPVITLERGHVDTNRYRILQDAVHRELAAMVA